MSGWPDIKMTGTPDSSASGTSCWIESARQSAVQQHGVDAAAAQTFDRGSGGFRPARIVDILECVHDHLRDERIVFDDEDMRTIGHHWAPVLVCRDQPDLPRTFSIHVGEKLPMIETAGSRMIYFSMLSILNREKIWLFRGRPHFASKRLFVNTNY